MNKTEYNHHLLRAIMIEKYGSIKNFCKAFGCSQQAMSSKLRNKTRFSVDDIEKIISAEFLNIPRHDIPEYFFDIKIK